MKRSESSSALGNRVKRRVRHEIIKLIKGVLKPPLHLLLRLEQYNSSPRPTNELSLMYAFLFKHITRTCPQRILDVGTGTSSLPHLMSHCGAEVVAVDKFGEYWARRPLNRHFLVVPDDICNSRISGSFDMVTCIDVLQHVPQHLHAVSTMARLLRPGGIAIIGCFFNENHYVPDVYRLPESNAFGRSHNYSCQMLSRTEIESWTATTGFCIADQELWNCFTGEYWTFGERLQPPRPSCPTKQHHVICLCLEKR